MDWALAAIKQAESLSSGTEILWTFFCIYLLVSTCTKSLWLLSMKFFDGCEKILYTILGGRPYTAIIERWERCRYLPAVKYPGWCLYTPYKSSISINEVNNWDETVWMCGGICPVCHVYAHLAWHMPLSPAGCVGLWFVLWWDMSHHFVSANAPVWGALSFICVALSLHGHVLAPWDVISGGHVVSDQSLGSIHVQISIISNLVR